MTATLFRSFLHPQISLITICYRCICHRISYVNQNPSTPCYIARYGKATNVKFFRQLVFCNKVEKYSLAGFYHSCQIWKLDYFMQLNSNFHSDLSQWYTFLAQWNRAELLITFEHMISIIKQALGYVLLSLRITGCNYIGMIMDTRRHHGKGASPHFQFGA